MQYLRSDVGLVLLGGHVREVEGIDVDVLAQELNADVNMSVTPTAIALQNGDGCLIVDIDARPRRVI